MDELTVRLYNVRFGDGVLISVPDKDEVAGLFLVPVSLTQHAPTERGEQVSAGYVTVSWHVALPCRAGIRRAESPCQCVQEAVQGAKGRPRIRKAEWLRPGPLRATAALCAT